MSDLEQPDYQAEIDAVKGRRGRRTKREEGLLFLEDLGLPLSLADQLNVGPAPKVAPELVSGRAMASQVLGELARRLADPAEAAKIPGTALVGLVDKLRALVDEEAVDPNAPVEPLLTVAEVIAGIEGLPAARKREILEGERTLLRAELAAVDGQLEAA